MRRRICCFVLVAALLLGGGIAVNGAGFGIDIGVANLPEPSKLTDAEIATFCASRAFLTQNFTVTQRNVQYLDYLSDLKSDLDAALLASDAALLVVGGAATAILILAPEPTTTVAGVSLATVLYAGDVSLFVLSFIVDQNLGTAIDEEILRIARNNSLNVSGYIYRSKLQDAVTTYGPWFNPHLAIVSAVGRFFQNAFITGDLFFVPKSTINYLDRVAIEQVRRELEGPTEDPCVFLEHLASLCYEFWKLDEELFNTYGPPWTDSKFRAIIRGNKDLLDAAKDIRDALLEKKDIYPVLYLWMTTGYSAFRGSPYAEHAELWLEGKIAEGNKAMEERNEALGKLFDKVQYVEREILRICPDAEIHPWSTHFWRNPN